MLISIFIIIYYLYLKKNIEIYKLILSILSSILMAFFSGILVFSKFNFSKNLFTKFTINFHLTYNKIKYFLLIFLTTFIFNISNNMLLELIKDKNI